MESLDYRYHAVHTNSVLAKPANDGSYIIYVAHDADIAQLPPRLRDGANWLTTAGHDCGTMCFRWIHQQSDPVPQPDIGLVTLGQLLS